MSFTYPKFHSFPSGLPALGVASRARSFLFVAESCPAVQWTTAGLFVQRHPGLVQSGAVVEEAGVDVQVRSLCGSRLPSLLGKYLRVELLVS